METLAIVILATLVESLVQFLFVPFLVVKPYLGYIALGFGIAVAIAYQVDVPSLVGLSSPYPFVDYIVSGLIIGRGSNYVNDIISIFTKKALTTTE